MNSIFNLFRILSISCIFAISSTKLFAQSDYVFSQNIFNEFLYNPAAAGNSFTTSAFVQTRNQWIGVSGAPSIQAASVDTYIESINSGLGISFSMDKISRKSSSSGRFAYAYNLPLLEKSALSLGLSAGFLNRSIDTGSGSIENPNDPEVGNDRSETSLDFEFGLEFRGPLKFGFSIRHLGPKDNLHYYPQHSTNYWAYLSSRFNVSNSLSIEPTLSYIFNEQGSRVEAGAIFYFMKDGNTKYNDKFWVGTLYRQTGEVTILAGLHLTPQIRLGYAFDYGLFGQLSTLAKQGSHEVFIAFQFNRIFYKEPLCPAYRNAGYRR